MASRTAIDPVHVTALMSVMVVCSLMQYALGALGPWFTGELGLTRVELGLLVSVLFASAALSSPVVGVSVQRWGVSRTLPLPFVAMACAFIGLAYSSTFGWLAVWVAIGGLGMAASNPLTNQAIAVAPGLLRIGPMIGWKQSGIQLGGFLSGLVLPVGVVRLGIRPLAIGVSVAVLLAMTVTCQANIFRTDGWAADSSGGSANRGRSGRRAETRGPWSPSIPMLSVYALLMGAVVGSINTYLPLFAYETLDYSMAASGGLIAAIGLSALVARIAWGYLCEQAEGVSLLLSGISATGSVALVALVLLVPSVPALVWVIAAVLGATVGAWNTVAMFAVVRGYASTEAGRVSSTIQLGNFLGFCVGSPLMGLIVDRVGAYRLAWSTVIGLLWIATMVSSKIAGVSRRGVSRVNDWE